jgi:hypothetical protein
LQFSDKFFDEDPGLIKLDGLYTTYSNNDKKGYPQVMDHNNSCDSIEYISNQLNILNLDGKEKSSYA